MTTRITAPGVFDNIPAARYHRDDLCEQPTLSASIGKVLVEQSPAHAKALHPRLSEQIPHEPTRQKEVGTAAHEMLLGRGGGIVVIDADDYKTGAAKTKRAEAYAADKSPILRPDADVAVAMVEAAREELLHYPDLRPLVDGKGMGEAVIVWREGEAWCRSMIDWLHPSRTIRADYKTTTASAHPADVASRLFGTDTPFSDRFYRRGLRALGIKTQRSFYIMQEVAPPYALSVVEFDAQADETAEEKVALAIETWARCMRTGQWPAYERRVAVAETPPWYVSRWNNRQLAHAALAEAEGRAA